MAQPVVTVAVEGTTDEAVIRRLLSEADLATGPVHLTGGKTKLDKNLFGYNNAARFAPWLVLRDLDQDSPCASALIGHLLPTPSAHMRLRVAVRATETWLLADRDGLSRFLKIAAKLLPKDPEAETDPKQTMITLAARSRDQRIRRDMVPGLGLSSRVGPGYVARLIEFATVFWRPEQAAGSSNSLKRCLEALKHWRKELGQL